MTAQRDVPGPDTGSYEVIHLGGQAAVVVPVADFLRLRGLERAAARQELEDAEDTAAILEWKARDTAGRTTFVTAEEARRRLGMPRRACGSTTTNGPSARPLRSSTTRPASARS